MTVTTPAATWVDEGTTLFLDALARLSDADLDAPCPLPGWSRRHLLAHVASNAEAVGRLVSWARTGVESRMYASPEQRAADIKSGATRPAPELRAWVRRSAEELAEGFAGLSAGAWLAQVVTAQRRMVPATELPWMRAREVAVHAVDLGAGLAFADLPDGFCRALVDDIARWRATRGGGPALVLEAIDADAVWEVSGGGTPPRVALPVAELAAWLAGRLDLPGLPTLPSWL